MLEIKPENLTHAKIDGPLMKCPYCQSPFFSVLTVNTCRDIPHDLFGKIQTFNIDNLYVLECLQCGKLKLPTYSHYTLNQDDMKLIKILTEIIKNRNKQTEVE